MILTPALQRLLFFQPDPNSTARRNALLTAAFPPFFAPEDADGDYPSGPASILAMPWASAPEAFRRKSASWRRMLVVQPPARTLLMTNTHHTPGGTYQRHGRVSLNPGDGGLRMGLLYDLVLPLVEYRAARFCLRWPGYDGIALGGEVTLDTSDQAHAVPYKSPLGKRFFSKAVQNVRVEVGDIVWVN